MLNRGRQYNLLSVIFHLFALFKNSILENENKDINLLLLFFIYIIFDIIFLILFFSHSRQDLDSMEIDTRRS